MTNRIYDLRDDYADATDVSNISDKDVKEKNRNRI
jgi:hypothetical protein